MVAVIVGKFLYHIKKYTVSHKIGTIKYSTTNVLDVAVHVIYDNLGCILHSTKRKWTHLFNSNYKSLTQ